MKSLSQILFSFLLLSSSLAWSQRATSLSPLSLSQGISSPNTTSLLNQSGGWVYQNPAGAALLGKSRLSLEYDSSTNNHRIAAELGVSGNSVGLDVGYQKYDCSGCSGGWGAVGGYNAGGFALGLGYRDTKTSSIGLLLNPEGPHRFGFAADIPSTSTGLAKAFGAGYSYVGSSVGFALDVSKKESDPKLESDKILRITPGVMLKADSFALSVGYDNYTNDDTKLYESKTWVGLGLVGLGHDLNLNIYKDYSGADWSVVLSFFF